MFLFSQDPLPISGVVNLAGPANLEKFLPLDSRVCGDSVITKLIGGLPWEVPNRYREASPSNLLPIGVKQILINGSEDRVVLPEFGKQYEQEAQAKGDDVTFVLVENAAHFEVTAPGSVAWPRVEEAVLSVLQSRHGKEKTPN